MRIGTCAAACAAACLFSTPGWSQPQALTLADVLARARERAPQVVSARLALDESRGRLVGASVRLQSNPEIDGALGRRDGPGGQFTDFGIGVAQTFEGGSRRQERVAGATAAIAQSSAEIDMARRTAQRAAAIAYFQVLHADQRIRLLATSEDLAATVTSVADRRFRAGDIAILDVNIARSALARVRAARELAEGGKAAALGELKQLLQLDADIALSGELATSPAVGLDALFAAAAERPELRAIEAAIQEADAQARLGAATSKPDYGLGVRYSHEEGDHILLGGLTVTLPVFIKGQELSAVGSARATRLRAELEAAKLRIRLEVQSAFDAYNRRLAAVRLLQTDAIAGLDENERLTTRSFEVGQLGLPELLLLRREMLDTRSQYLDALLDAAVGRIELDAAAGVLR